MKLWKGRIPKEFKVFSWLVSRWRINMVPNRQIVALTAESHKTLAFPLNQVLDNPIIPVLDK